jgi:hypothetical protein
MTGGSLKSVNLTLCLIVSLSILNYTQISQSDVLQQWREWLLGFSFYMRHRNYSYLFLNHKQLPIAVLLIVSNESTDIKTLINEKL